MRLERTNRGNGDRNLRDPRRFRVSAPAAGCARRIGLASLCSPLRKGIEQPWVRTLDEHVHHAAAHGRAPRSEVVGQVDADNGGRGALEQFAGGAEDFAFAATTADGSRKHPALAHEHRGAGFARSGTSRRDDGGENGGFRELRQPSRDFFVVHVEPAFLWELLAAGGLFDSPEKYRSTTRSLSDRDMPVPSLRNMTISAATETAISAGV